MNALHIFPFSKTFKSKFEPFWPISQEIKGHFASPPVEKLIVKFKHQETLFMGISRVLFKTNRFKTSVKTVFMFGKWLWNSNKFSYESNLL